MFILPLQYDSHRGPDSIGQHKFTFSMDESVQLDQDVFNPMSIKKGTQYVVIFVEADNPNAFKQETTKEATARLQRRMFALTTEIAKIQDVPVEEVKTKLKAQLKLLNIINESTTELDLQGYAKVINILLEKKNELTN